MNSVAVQMVACVCTRMWMNVFVRTQTTVIFVVVAVRLLCSSVMFIALCVALSVANARELLSTRPVIHKKNSLAAQCLNRPKKSTIY